MVVAFRTFLLPKSIWELDEVLFTEGVLRFDPLHHHPHPPGYPLTIALGKLVHLFVADPFRSLLIVSLISSAVATAALFLAAEKMLGDYWSALAATLVGRGAAAVLVHGALALSDPPANMFVTLALLALAHERDSRWRAVGFGAALAAAIGCRPQYAAALVPLLFASILIERQWRHALAALTAFTAVCLAWLVPLIRALGGVSSFLQYEFGQAAYVAQADAYVSRSGFSLRQLCGVFLSHPFGPKWIAVPIIAIAVVGLLSRKITFRHSIPLIVLIVAHSLFTFRTSDPADGVRYMLPVVAAWAIFAGAGLWYVARLMRFAPAAVMLALSFFVASYVYCAPILDARRKSPSPTVQAAIWVHKNVRPDAMILYPRSLRPHSELLFNRYDVVPIESGMAASMRTPQRPVYRLTDGPTTCPAVATFGWPPSDAYRKLTRNHYRVVCVVAVQPEERFAVVRGIDGLESDATGTEWRWMHGDARIQLPPLKADAVTIDLALTPDASIDFNDVRIAVNGAPVTTVRVPRGAEKRVTLPLPAPSAFVDFHSAQTFRPAKRRRKHNRDPRELAVELRKVVVHRLP